MTRKLDLERARRVWRMLAIRKALRGLNLRPDAAPLLRAELARLRRAGKPAQ